MDLLAGRWPRNGGSNAAILGAGAGCEPGGDALPVLGAAVLAELALAVETVDRQPEADDAAKLGPDEGGRRVAHLPGVGAGRFVAVGEAGDDFEKPVLVGEEFDRAIGMHR